MPQLQPFQAGPSALVCAPYLNDAKTHFATDFWMENRIGAMTGASFLEYVQAVGVNQFGARPPHTKVMGADIPGAGWTEAMTSAGDCGWMDGESYEWLPLRSDPENFAAWVAAGCPSKNSKGEWGAQGFPLEYIKWTWLHPSVRGPSPIAEARKAAKAAAGIPAKDHGKKRK